jgi:hypothetical protein
VEDVDNGFGTASSYEAADPAGGRPRGAPVSLHSFGGVDPGLLLLLGGAASAAVAVSGRQSDGTRRSGPQKRSSDWMDAGQRQGSVSHTRPVGTKVPRLREFLHPHCFE